MAPFEEIASKKVESKAFEYVAVKKLVVSRSKNIKLLRFAVTHSRLYVTALFDNLFCVENAA